MNKAKLAQKLFLFPLLLSVLFLISCEEIVGFEPIKWVEVGTEGAPEFQNGWQNHSINHQPLAFGIDQDNMLNIIGTIRDADQTGSRSVIFTLPEAYRPSQTQYATVGAYAEGAGNIICNFIIYTYGDVEIRGDNPVTTYGMNVRVKR